MDTQKQPGSEHVSARQEWSIGTAWTSYKPQAVHLRKLFRKHPHTTILTCSRVGAHVVNHLMLKARYRYQPLVTLDADVESNPENYHHGIGFLGEETQRSEVNFKFQNLMLKA